MKSIAWTVSGICIVALIAGLINNRLQTGKLDLKKQWPAFSSLQSQEQPETSDDLAAVEQEDPEQAFGELAAEIEGLQGIQDINLTQARRLFLYANDLLLWVDAREDSLFEKGHIQGAIQLYFYEQANYLQGFETAYSDKQPLALVIYCKGKDCHDSHFLAEDLLKMGYSKIFVYRDGFDDWFKAGLPIEGELSQTQANAASPEAGISTEPDPKKGMYLEHILRDSIPFVLGVFLFILWMRKQIQPRHVTLAMLVLAAFFIFAAIPKIGNPLEFAKSIWNYDIAPSILINYGAIGMPWLELIAALAILVPLLRRGASGILLSLLVVFIVAVGFNVLRGHDFNCGCTSTKTFLTQTFLSGWNDKYMLLLRDFGLLVMAGLGLRAQASQSEVSDQN
ncbi:MAG: hypothetical protein H6510_03980 [Acidobacteria bacterium]|nr:hypothetical protein [Acidobacteriota bacterium]